MHLKFKITDLFLAMTFICMVSFIVSRGDIDSPPVHAHVCFFSAFGAVIGSVRGKGPFVRSMYWGMSSGVALLIVNLACYFVFSFVWHYLPSIFPLIDPGRELYFDEGPFLELFMLCIWYAADYCIPVLFGAAFGSCLGYMIVYFIRFVRKSQDAASSW